MKENCVRCGKEDENDGTFPKGMMTCFRCRTHFRNQARNEAFQEAFSENGYYA